MKNTLLRIFVLVIALISIGEIQSQTMENVSLTQGGTSVSDLASVTVGSVIDCSYTLTTPATGTYRVAISQWGPKSGGTGSSVKIGSLSKKGAAVDLNSNVISIQLTTLTDDAVSGDGTIDVSFAQENAQGKWDIIGQTLKIPLTWFSPTTTINNVEWAYSVYPNPAKETLKVEAPIGSEVSIFSVTGTQIFKTVQGSSISNVPVSEFSTGVYIVKIVSEGETVTEKIKVL